VIGALVAFASTLSAYCDDAQNVARGFSPTGASQGGDIENINLFNGNLTLNVPVTPSYPLNGGGSYAIALVFTGQPWDFLVPSVGGKLKVPYPNRRSNAGLGWRVSLGRIITPDDETNSSFNRASWEYESPDGSDHIFYDTLHPADTSATGVHFTRDGTYLRLREIAGGLLEIDFPNGMTHQFKVTGEVQQIRTPFDSVSLPSVTVDYLNTMNGAADCKDAGASSCWVIADRLGRTQYVTFEADSHLRVGKRARKILLTGPLDTSNSPRTITYDLAYKDSGSTTLYTDRSIDPNKCYDVYAGQGGGLPTPPSYQVPMLDSVTVNPGGPKYSFDYYNTADGSGCSQGSLHVVTLPTLGTRTFTYQNYMAGIAEDSDPPYVPGVATMIKNGDANSGLWTYTVTPGDSQTYADGFNEKAELLVKVTRPDHAVIKSYFAIAKHAPYGGEAGWNNVEYGLPLTHRAGTNRTDNGGVGRYLSTQTFVSDSATTPSQSTYVAYEEDGNVTTSAHRGDDNRRIKNSLVLFGADSGRWIASDNSDFDTFGHYRTNVTTPKPGAFASDTVRAATTHYTPSTSPFWILGLFDFKMVSDTSAAAKTFRTDACFDTSTGFLKRTRRRADTATTPGTGPADVVVVHDPDGNGNVAAERTYAKSIGADLCGGTFTNGDTPVVELHHTYDKGTRVTSTYFANGSAMAFNVVDATVDPIAVPKTRKDVSGHATTYAYDDLARTSTVTPPAAGTPASYTYENATATTPSRVTVQQGPWKTIYEYDAFGRLVKESRDMPPATASSPTRTAIRTTTYDALNQKTSVSEWQYSTPTANATQFVYDEYGRVTSTTLPDTKFITTSYTDVSQIVRTAKVATTNGETSVTTTEDYDASGRLAKVTDPKGIVTTYDYDAADHLIHVCVNSTSCQNRQFNYDGRGFLLDETHPENGKTVYTYDAAGHVLTKQVGDNPSDRDLRFSYDPAERLTMVERRKSDGTYETLNSFAYSSTAGDTLGRLLTATRHNYDYAPDGSLLRDMQVTESYSYDSAGRSHDIATEIAKIVGTQTTIMKTFSQSQDYDALNEPTVTTYPVCVPANQCATSALTLTSVNDVYANGFLTSVTNFADLTRAANGMITTVDHKRTDGTVSMTDTYAEDPNLMPRPKSITFARCTSFPQITNGQPADQTASNGTANLNVTPTNFSYQWYSVVNSVPTAIPNANGPSLTVNNALYAAQYLVVASTPCGKVTSRTATVTGSCPAIRSVSGNQTINSGQSPAALSVTATGDPTLHYQWFRGAAQDSSAPISNSDSSTYSPGALNATTQYWVRVSNWCTTPASSGTITITVGPPLPKPAGLQATASNTAVSVTWQAVTGADHYKLYALAAGQADFTLLVDNIHGLSVADSIPAGSVRAYRVVAVDSSGGSASPPSDPDIASAIVFDSVAAGTPITFHQFDQILTAANAIRAAGGGTPVTWTSILQPFGVSPPAVGAIVQAAHVAALHNALNAARGLIPGLGAISYTDPTSGSPIYATNITQLQAGAR
jgi:YD repeat-containing protein